MAEPRTPASAYQCPVEGMRALFCCPEDAKAYWQDRIARTWPASAQLLAWDNRGALVEWGSAVHTLEREM